MIGQIPEYVRSRIQDVPESVLNANKITESGAKKLMILESLKVMEAGKAIVFDKDEFYKEFGKYGKPPKR